mgnify:CR=1 FL=1
MATCKDIERLEAPFIFAAKWVLHLVKEESLPFMIYETYRTAETQNKYFKRGVTKARAGESPHNFGLAMDLVLDTKKVDVRKREWRGHLYPDAWDDVSPDAVTAWVRLGEIVEDVGLTWGGSWIKKGTKPKESSDGRLVVLGWDLPHVQLSNWRDYT